MKPIAFAAFAFIFGSVTTQSFAQETRQPLGQEKVETKTSRFAKHNHAHGIETENMFGFTLGSDTDEKGSIAIAVENVGRFYKRDGKYSATAHKLEFAYGVFDNLSLAGGILGSFHSIKNVTGFTNVEGLRFNGLGGEVRWRLLERAKTGVGVTLHLEPSWQTHDEMTGIKGLKFGSENKLIFDKELIKDKLFGAINLTQEMEKVREKGAGVTERGSVIGVSTALSYQVLPQLFLGAEARYLRSYDGFDLKTYNGDAVYVGPTIFWHSEGNMWASLAWSSQVLGHEKGLGTQMNLDGFEKHQARLKFGVHF